MGDRKKNVTSKTGYHLRNTFRDHSSSGRAYALTDSTPNSADSPVLVLVLPFVSAIFTSAVLLFLVEPLAGRLVLPLFGGSPSVWNTCMVFFQIVLLAAYAYAHLLSTRASLRSQMIIHCAVLAAAAVCLPVRLPWVPETGPCPVARLLISLTASIGPLFFAISATNPLMQSWFSRLGTAFSRDPYGLYAASNLGSLIGVLSYPLFIQHVLSLESQGIMIAFGYGLLALFILTCGCYCYCHSYPDHPPPSVREPAGRLNGWRQARWILLAAMPASLMLGLTTYVTSDMASVPLFWAVPLAIYLTSFILMFSSLASPALKLSRLIMPFSAIASLALLTSSEALESYRLCQSTVLTGLGAHLLAFLALCCVCHGEIYRDRPSTGHLTSFYMLIALGGVLGSSLNCFAAPVLFDSPLEYPLVLVLAIIFLSDPPGRIIADNDKRPLQPDDRGLSRSLRLARPLFFKAIAVLVIGTIAHWLEPWIRSSLSMLDPQARILALAAWIFGPALLLISALCASATEYRLLLAVLLAIAIQRYCFVDSSTVRQSRNFFGCMSLRLNESGDKIEQWSGPTRHGQQSTDPWKRDEAMTYYSPTGPGGSVLTELTGDERGRAIAVIGLGVGTLASYADKGDSLTFYEINPDVIEVADKPFYFTYLRAARNRGAEINIIEGDGRLKIGEAPDRSFDIIVLDAFSSDFIPTHLLTREAIAVYKSKLKDDGLILFHLSNKYYDLSPVIARTAAESGLLSARLNDTQSNSEKDSSEWLAATGNDEFFLMLTGKLGFEYVPENMEKRPWSDDFCDPLEHLRQR